MSNLADNTLFVRLRVNTAEESIMSWRKSNTVLVDIFAGQKSCISCISCFLREKKFYGKLI